MRRINASSDETHDVITWQVFDPLHFQQQWLTDVDLRLVQVLQSNQRTFVITCLSEHLPLLHNCVRRPFAFSQRTSLQKNNHKTKAFMTCSSVKDAQCMHYKTVYIDKSVYRWAIARERIFMLRTCAQLDRCKTVCYTKRTKHDSILALSFDGSDLLNARSIYASCSCTSTVNELI